MTEPDNYSSWIQEDESLLLQIDGSVLTVSAQDVFLAEFEHCGDVQGQRVRPPSKDLPHIKFSRFPCFAGLRSSLNGETPESPCLIEETLVLPNGRQCLRVRQLAGDHVVVDGTWYPIEPSSYEQVSSIAGVLGLTLPSAISLADYLRVIELSRDSGLLDDTIGDDLSARTWSAELLPVSVSGLHATLYPYQVQGVSWLVAMANQGLGCILADEMGLGKTLQVIGLLARELAHLRGPNLVVAPPSLLENWRREVAKFAPDVAVHVHAGPRRTGFPAVLADRDLVLTSYDTIRFDTGLLTQVAWNVVVLDEAQAIKNPDARRTQAAKLLPRRCGVAVTGTPLQNSLLDVWSVVDFCVPGLLGADEPFRGPGGLDEGLAVRTERVVTPLMLRRLVDEVGNDLPPRVDIPELLLMDESEASDYEQLRQLPDIQSLAMLQRLRMYCTHPRLKDSNPLRSPSADSAKYRRLLEILREVTESREKALVFTSYLDMIDAIVADLPAQLGCRAAGIDGRVDGSDRQGLVDALNDGELDVLVLNPQVGGTGLNITGANHVIHYNLEWNPAAIDQASARAHRRGQDKPVFVHYLMYAGTVEEVIQARLDRKRDLADVAVRGTDGGSLETDDLARALAMSPSTFPKGDE